MMIYADICLIKAGWLLIFKAIIQSELLFAFLVQEDKFSFRFFFGSGCNLMKVYNKMDCIALLALILCEVLSWDYLAGFSLDSCCCGALVFYLLFSVRSVVNGLCRYDHLFWL